MDALQTVAANTALQKMFAGGHFDICTIKKILEVTKGTPAKYDMDVLSLLHCVDFSAMPVELREELPNVLQRVLGSEKIEFGYTKKPSLESIVPEPPKSRSGDGKVKFLGFSL